MPTYSEPSNGKVLNEREDRPIMLRYASKLFLEMFLSVLATVVGSYLANQYIADRSAVDAPVSLAREAVDPKRVDANATSHEAVKADLTSPQGPSDVVVAAIGSSIVD